MKKSKTLLQIFCFLALIAISINAIPVRAELEPSRAEALFEKMSAEEKVGQLFLVTFDGTEVEEGSNIHNLITNHHIGGVVLLAENNNFLEENTIAHAQELITALQRLEWDTARVDNPNYIPLFIGMKQIGNGFPGDQILSGMTKLPSQMAIGATWDLELARRGGEVLGKELSTLGVNLYLGPNLDVLETANNEAVKALGVNTYGGDPFWVGEMGQAFVRGVHMGSDLRMLVVAQNFPGTGNSDRAPEFEVATIRKSLEQLKQIELAPYFSLTSPAVGEPGRVGAVMVSHIRYQGFQGNIRATTRPISFDPNALQQVMALPQFLTWRENGGLIISDNLGSGAVQRFFDPNDISFDARSVARNAFLAGNDILYIDGLVATGDPDANTTLLSIIEFFVQKYREDSAFAKRVDSSVLRILEAKANLYEDFVVWDVVGEQGELDIIGQSQDVTFDIAQNAVTLISPSVQELDTFIPSPPLWHEDIIIFTDVRTVYQCDDCPPTSDVSTNALANALIGLYGPQAGGLILQNKLASYSFLQLAQFLDNGETETSEALSSNLRAAEWVVFNTLNTNPNHPGSNALQRVLEERPDLLDDKKVIVFAMGTPTYLDATDISKITAYYGLYSKAPEFLDVAARVLMQEIVPTGALPVSLNAVGYDLITMTAPDPNQVIKLELVLPEIPAEGVSEEQSPEPAQDITPAPDETTKPSFELGDTITIRTGQIYDHNQNVIPDGTIVRFNFRISGEPGITQQFETITTAGRASFNYLVETVGSLEISAVSEPATQSETLQVVISSDGSTTVLAFTPTPEVTPSPTEVPTATPTEQPTATTIVPDEPDPNSFPTLGEWALGVIVMGLGGGLTFLIGYIWWGSSRWGMRSSLCALIGSLLAYSYLNLGVEGTKHWMETSGTIFVIEMVVVGLLVGWIVALIWWMRTEGRYPSRRLR